MKSIYIHNTHTRDDVCVHYYDSTDEISNRLRWYTERYSAVVFILDFDDKISYGSIGRLLMALEMLDGIVIDITLRCDNLSNGYRYYDDIKKLIERD